MTDLAKPLAADLGRHLKHERGARPYIVKSCAVAFKMLAGSLAERRGIRPCELSIRDLDAGNILAFLDHLETARKNSAATRSMRSAAVRAFFRNAVFKHPEYLDVAARIRAIPCKWSDHPAREEMRALINGHDRTIATGLCDHAVPCLACDSDLRISVLVGLSLAVVGQPGYAARRRRPCIKKVDAKARRQPQSSLRFPQECAASTAADNFRPFILVLLVMRGTRDRAGEFPGGVQDELLAMLDEIG